MAFLAVAAKFISQEILTRVGKDALAEGQRVFSEQLAKGTPKKEAAKIAAEHLMKFTAKKSAADAVKVGKAAGRVASKVASKGAAMGAKILRDKMGKK